MSSIPRAGKLGIGGATLAVAVALGVGFTPPLPQEQLPTVEVWHDPT